MVSFVEKFGSATRNTSLFEVKAIDETGRPAWYFLRVPRLKVPGFERAMKKGAFDLADYGEIVDSGYGEDVPEDVRKQILEEENKTGSGASDAASTASDA